MLLFTRTLTQPTPPTATPSRFSDWLTQQLAGMAATAC